MDLHVHFYPKNPNSFENVISRCSEVFERIIQLAVYKENTEFEN